MATSEMLLTLPQKSATDHQLHLVGHLPSLLAVESASSNSITSSQSLRPDDLATETSAFTSSPKESSTGLLSSWLQGSTLRGSGNGQMFGTSNGCVLPPVGEIQRSNSGIDILGMLNCSRLQGNSATTQDTFIDFSVLPKIDSLDHRMGRQLTDYSKHSLSDVGLPHLSVSKVKVPFVDLKQTLNGTSGSQPQFSLDSSALVESLVHNVSSQVATSIQPSSATAMTPSNYVDPLTAAGHHGDISLLNAADQNPGSGSGWSDLSKDWNAGAQEIGALLSTNAAPFPDFAENVFSQCVEEIHCYKCKFCPLVYISLSKDDAVSHLVTNHSKEIEFLQRGGSDSSWGCTEMIAREYASHAETGTCLPSLEGEMVNQQQQSASYVCGKCHKTFGSLKECQEHMASVHQVRSSRIREDKGPRNSPQPIKATQKAANEESEDQRPTRNCKPVVRKKDLKLKVMSKKRMKRENGCYICEFKGCNVRFRLLDNLQYHYKCHVNGSSTFACPECSGSAQRWNSMAGHLWRQHVIDLELHACDRCSFRTYNLSLLENLHKRTHGDERPYLCDTCGKSFKTNKQLRSHKVLHLRRAHGGSQQQPSGGGECAVCRRRFSDKRMLRVHLDTVHRKTKPYLCNYCGYAASSKSTLRMHLRQHTGEKPFACDQCDYRTADHNSLRRHRMRHSGEKPYKCPYCNYACIQSSTYKSHLKSKHPGQDKGLMFSCSVCPFHTIKEETYLTHVADHNLDSFLAAVPRADNEEEEENASDPFLSLVEAVQIGIDKNPGISSDI